MPSLSFIPTVYAWLGTANNASAATSNADTQATRISIDVGPECGGGSRLSMRWGQMARTLTGEWSTRASQLRSHNR